MFVRVASLGVSLALLLACGSEETRGAELASVFTRADEAVLRTRPKLVAGKYAQMAALAFDFYRGQLAVFRNDWQQDLAGLADTAYENEGAPLVVGDPHPENFGLMAASDGTFALEPNDFDSATRALYLWDVRRLAAGMSIAARGSNGDNAAQAAAAIAASKAIATAAAESYAIEIAALAAGAPRKRIDASAIGTSPILADLFSRAMKDSADSQTLVDDTVLDANNARHLKRGVLDPTSPYNTFGDVPATAIAALPAALEAYRRTLIAPPPSEYFTILDVVREFGAGIASWPRVRLIVLVRGPSDANTDDQVLEVKELVDEALPSAALPDVFFDNPGDRIRRTTRAAWARPDADPLWSATTWLGFDCQVRTESSAFKKVSVDRLVDQRGTVQALTGLAQTLGTLLARIHASPLSPGETPAISIATSIHGDVAGFAAEQGRIGDAYATQVIADYAIFQQLLADRGPLLGFTPDPADAPSPDLAAIYGDPSQ